MAQLLGLRVQNFKSLADIKLGQIGPGQEVPLSALACFIGPNGSGKSALLDAFGFIADCLREGVRAACDSPQRGGFSKLRTRGGEGAIRFDLYYRENLQARPLTYSFAVDEVDGIPAVIEETLLWQQSRRQKYGSPYILLSLKRGAGHVWSGETLEKQGGSKFSEVELADIGRLGIATFGQLKEHPRIVGLRSYIEKWRFSSTAGSARRSLALGFEQGRAAKGIFKVAPFFLEERESRSLIGIEEPESGLYPSLLNDLARELLGYVEQSMEKSQVLVTTYSPYFIDALKPEQVWFMKKAENGHTNIVRIADMPIISEMTKEGIPLGSLWYSNHIEEGVDCA